MKKIIAMGFLLASSAFAEVSPLEIPPEETILTTLVVDHIIDTAEAKKYGYGDIAILSGIHVELENQFGQIKNLGLAETEQDIVCQFAGYKKSYGREQTAPSNGSAIIYRTGVGFVLGASDNYLTGIACVKEKIQPPPGKTRIAAVEKTIVFGDLNADKIERLVLPTGVSYIRIVNPNAKFSEPLFGVQDIYLGFSDSGYHSAKRDENWNAYCRMFGYSGQLDIDGVTEFKNSNGKTWAIDVYERYFPYTVDLAAKGNYVFQVLTCKP